MDNSANTDLIRSHVNTIILRSLQDNDKYGYEICKEIEDKSEGCYKLKQPTLYSCLKRLESQGFINSYWGEVSNGGRRRYYALTNKGREYLERDKYEWEYSRTLINRLLSDKEYDLKDSIPPFEASELRPYTKVDTRGLTPDNHITINSQNIDESEKLKTPSSTHCEVIPTAAENIIQNDVLIDNTNSESNVSQDAEIDALKLFYEKYSCKVEDHSQAPVIADRTGFSIPVDTCDQFDIVSSAETDNTPNSSVFGVSDNTENDSHYTIDFDNSNHDAIDESSDTQVSDIESTSTICEENSIAYNTYIENETLSNTNKQDLSTSIEDDDSYFTASLYNHQPSYAYSNNVNDESVIKTDEETDPRFNYKSKLFDLFSKNNQVKENYQPKSNIVEESVVDESSPSLLYSRPSGFSELQSKLYSEGFKLRPYSKSNVNSYYSMSFVYANKLALSTYLITYLLLWVELALVYFLFNNVINIKPEIYIYLGVVGLVIPLVPTVMYIMQPNKRIKANYNFKFSLINRLSIYLLLAVFILIAGFFIFNADIQDFSTLIIPIIIPLILLINLPLSAVIYNLLYKTKKYHLS